MYDRRAHRIHRRFAGRRGDRAPRAPARFAGLPRETVGGLEVPVADGFRARLLGLAHLDLADAGQGLLLPRCASVHTFGMRFELDLYFLGRDGELLDLRRSVPPRRFAAHTGAAAVLEIPSEAGIRLASPRLP